MEFSVDGAYFVECWVKINSIQMCLTDARVYGPVLQRLLVQSLRTSELEQEMEAQGSSRSQQKEDCIN